MQQQNPDLVKINNNNVSIHKNQPAQAFSNNLSPNSLPSISKNGTNPLLSPVHNRDFYHTSPPNYYSQQQPFIKEKKQTLNGSITSNYFSETNCNSGLIKPTNPSPDTKQQPITNNALVIDNRLSEKRLVGNNLNNSININTNSSLVLNHNTPNKSQTNELKNSLTVDLDPVKQKAETRTLILFKIVDQVILNGNVVKETIVKSDETIKHTGWIDWPITTQQQPIANCNNLLTTLTTNIDSNRSGSTTKKSTTPKGKNLKRSVNSNSQTKDKQEKKVKTEDSKSIVKPEVLNEKIVETAKIDSKLETIKTETTKKIEITPEMKISPTTPGETLAKSRTSSPNLVKQTTKIENNCENELLLPNSNFEANNTDKQVPASTTISNYIFEDPIFKPIDVNQRVLAKWTDKNYYSGTVLSKENDSKWRIGFDDGGRRLVRENEIISVEFVPRGQQVMVSYSVDYASKGIIRSYRYNSTNNQAYYLIEYVVNLKCVENEFNAKDVYLNAEQATSLLNRRKPNMNDSKFADVDLNNIIPKRARISNKNLNDLSNSSLNSSTNDAKTPLTTELEMLDNDSNSNLSCSTVNSSTTNSSTTKKSSKKNKPNSTTSKQQNISFNEDTQSSTINQLNVSTKSNSLELDFKLDSVKDSKTDNKPSKNDELFTYDESMLLGPIPKSSLFKSFAFLLSFEDEKPNSEEVAGYSIPFDIEHLTKQIKSGSGLILDKFEDIKVN